MINKYFNDAIIGNKDMTVSFSKTGELLRLFNEAPDYKQFFEIFHTGVKVNDSAMIYLHSDVNNNYKQYFEEGTNVLVTEIVNTYFNLKVIQTDFCMIGENVLVRKYHFINEGNMGLMRAIDEYDLSYNSKFSTYASNWIMNYIRRYYVDNESYIKIPYYLKINFMKYKKILGNCESKMSREEIKEFLNISDSELKRFEEYDFEFLSLNKPINDDESETYEEFLSSNYDLEENVMADVLKSDIKYLFSKLNSQEIRVISLRYGFELYNGK